MLSEKIKYLRKKHGFTQTDISEKLNMTQGAYGYYEQEKREPNIDTLKRLSHIYNVSVDYLLDNDTSIFNEAMEVNKAMGNVDSATRKRMVDTLKSAFPQAFNEYEWALSVIKENNMVAYNMLKEGTSELSESDIINMAKEIVK